jgi:hypothetical protein
MHMGRRIAALVVCLIATSPLAAKTGSFRPDWTFTGSSLDGWLPLGSAAWRAAGGEIVSTPKSAAGGWLILNQSYQDVQLGASFRCTGDCTVGIALRLERTPEGFKGVVANVAGRETGLYAVTLDLAGRETTRVALRPSGGNFRFAPPKPPAPTPEPGPMPGGIPSPFAPLPPAVARPGEWNDVEMLVEANILRTWVNHLRGSAGAAEEDMGSFGPIALHVGGTGDVHFRDIGVKDLVRRVNPEEMTGAGFRAQRIDDFYTAWSAATGDFNRDGILDLTAGHRYYLGPSFQESREIYLAQALSPAKEYAAAMVNFAFDYTGDGWDDVLVAETRTPVLYVNPRGESRRWTRHEILPAVTSEVVVFRDMDGDRRPDAIFVGGGVVAYASSDPANPTGRWRVRAVSAPGPWPIHGVGAGDVNGDGRVDLVTPYGWWEHPATDDGRTPWPYRPAALGRIGPPWGPGGAEMVVYDVNGDGLNDVVTSLAGHGFGLAWYEQRRDANGAATFVERMVMDDFSTENAGGVTFSELHGSTAADVDGDGITDFIVGKRHFAHLESYSDPDPHGPGVLYWYRTVRNASAPGGAELVPHLVHNRSGAGSTVGAVDLNRDGAIDVITATTRGTFIFWGSRR